LLTIRGVEIEDTFAEAFAMRATALVITADSAKWAQIAAQTATGYGTSIIGCDAEAGIDQALAGEETPDGRPGIRVLFFSINREELGKAILNRIGQCVLTCPTAACYSDISSEGEENLPLGSKLRFFGDGFQSSKLFGGRRLWRIPVMDGEFVCEETAGSIKGVAGGNFLIMAEDHAAGLEAAESASEAIALCPDVITPFPGGVCRSGSKVGSRYAGLKASCNEAYCPTLRNLAPSALPSTVGATYEIIVDGLSLPAVETALAAGIRAACLPGVVRIGAGNYGGKLGRYNVRLHDVLVNHPEQAART
jgi:formylmethanofuran--tetrahydromethanopterin N-formyltransferase